MLVPPLSRSTCWQAHPLPLVTHCRRRQWTSMSILPHHACRRRRRRLHCSAFHFQGSLLMACMRWCTKTCESAVLCARALPHDMTLTQHPSPHTLAPLFSIPLPPSSGSHLTKQGLQSLCESYRLAKTGNKDSLTKQLKSFSVDRKAWDGAVLSAVCPPSYSHLSPPPSTSPQPPPWRT
jgi:hypothetical protein